MPVVLACFIASSFPSIPLDPNLSLLSDEGKPYVFENENSLISNIFKDISVNIEKIIQIKND